ncbi:uncharacterized protein [Eulemur rufifrons]|uniref:uncharacterized protein isoform X3 n=1 Tax=Eulemur rufifrons TaxID=859984 RepID=UPI003744914F
MQCVPRRAGPACPVRRPPLGLVMDISGVSSLLGLQSPPLLLSGIPACRTGRTLVQKFSSALLPARGPPLASASFLPHPSLPHRGVNSPSPPLGRQASPAVCAPTPTCARKWHQHRPQGKETPVGHRWIFPAASSKPPETAAGGLGKGGKDQRSSSSFLFDFTIFMEIQVTERTIHPLEAHNSAAFRTSTACAAVATATDETVCSMLGRRGSLPLPLRGRALHRLFQPSSEAGAGRWVSTFPQPQPVRAPP